MITLLETPLTSPYAKFASEAFARARARNLGGVIFHAAPWFYVVTLDDARTLVTAGHVPHKGPTLPDLIRALGYRVRELVAWRREGSAWVLDLGPQHGGGVPQRVTFGEDGAVDFVYPGILGMAPEGALWAAVEVVSGAADVAQAAK